MNDYRYEVRLIVENTDHDEASSRRCVEAALQSAVETMGEQFVIAAVVSVDSDPEPEQGSLNVG